jgi:hypothetical protein
MYVALQYASFAGDVVESTETELLVYACCPYRIYFSPCSLKVDCHTSLSLSIRKIAASD